MGSKNLLKAFFSTSLLCYGFLLFSFIFECSHNNFQIWSGHFSSEEAAQRNLQSRTS